MLNKVKDCGPEVTGIGRFHCTTIFKVSQGLGAAPPNYRHAVYNMLCSAMYLYIVHLWSFWLPIVKDFNFYRHLCKRKKIWSIISCIQEERYKTTAIRYDYDKQLKCLLKILVAYSNYAFYYHTCWGKLLIFLSIHAYILWSKLRLEI